MLLSVRRCERLSRLGMPPALPDPDCVKGRSMATLEKALVVDEGNTDRHRTSRGYVLAFGQGESPAGLSMNTRSYAPCLTAVLRATAIFRLSSTAGVPFSTCPKEWGLRSVTCHMTQEGSLSDSSVAVLDGSHWLTFPHPLEHFSRRLSRKTTSRDTTTFRIRIETSHPHLPQWRAETTRRPAATGTARYRRTMPTESRPRRRRARDPPVREPWPRRGPSRVGPSRQGRALGMLTRPARRYGFPTTTVEGMAVSAPAAGARRSRRLRTSADERQTDPHAQDGAALILCNRNNIRTHRRTAAIRKRTGTPGPCLPPGADADGAGPRCK